MSLKDEIVRVAECKTHPPPNESCTCEWVILPLLWKAGYERHEIMSRVSDAAGKYPDYTILPGTACTWYLEAKDWNKELQNDQDLFQATNYAHTKGHRWVVLSNGREWRLYDDHIQGVEAPQRLVAVARLDEDELEQFLTALGRALGSVRRVGAIRRKIPLVGHPG
ncbi:MAG: hypothetical protein HY320_16020 [Armatimonadetes bacterium]|nr:hypothetical protein [Armatimonadota bacterium]